MSFLILTTKPPSHEKFTTHLLRRFEQQAKTERAYFTI